MSVAIRPYPSQFDCTWLASDAHGHLAVLTTGGEGPIPALALAEGRPDLDELEGLVEALALCSEVAFVKDVPTPDLFVDLARRGFFVFDWSDVHRTTASSLGAYELVARPVTPRVVGELPEALLRAIAGLQARENFSDIVSFEPSRHWDDVRV